MPRSLGALVVVFLAAGCAGDDEGEPALAGELGSPEEPGVRGVGSFWIDGEALELRYETIGEHRTFEGDIVLDDEVPAEVGADGVAIEPLFGVSRSSRLWPHGVVPYTIHSSVSTPGRVRTALRTWAATGIRFVPRTTERAYVTFLEEDGNGVCRAQVGYDGTRQYVYLRDTSRYTACNLGVIVHETGHVLGLWHEHTRPDRDEHVRVVWSHVPSTHRDAFEIMTSGARRIGAYDISSTMHYRSYTLTRDGGASITRRDGRLLLHDWATISAGDVAAIRALYFDGTPVPSSTPAPVDGGARDAGVRDAGAPDAGPRDAGVDAPPPALGAAPLGDAGTDAGATPADAATGGGADPGRDEIGSADESRYDLPPRDRALRGGCSASWGARSPLAGLAALALMAIVRRRRGGGQPP